MQARPKEIRLVLTRGEAAGIFAGAAVVGILLFLAGMGAGSSAGCAAPAAGPHVLAEAR
ncbi:MAG TPA: hypothetical protein VK420_15390 [Longimicrobium sp.]|nr:hypothetical protein [Longimicrobium sp.]